MTTTTDTLTLTDAVALSTILRAAQTNATVSWISDESGALIENGVARHITDQSGNFLRDDVDVRDGFLRISCTWEYFLPVRRLIEKVHDGTFAITDR